MTNEQKMWEMINKINWPKNCKNLNELKLFVLKTWTPKEGLALRKFCQNKWRIIYNIVNKAEKENGKRIVSGGDDTYSDKMWETISRGEAHYKKCMKDPSLIEETPYKECFGYCLPYELKDYEVLNKD